MSERIVLFDSDIFVLLSAADLFDDMLSLLEVNVSQVYRLPALPHQLKKGRAFRRYPADLLERAYAQADGLKAINDRPKDMELFDRLVAVENIDAGEALLLATLAERPSIYLSTGDRRSVVAFGTSPDLSPVRDKVKGRIISLEVSLVMLLNHLGEEIVGRKFKPIANVNKTLVRSN